MAAKKLAAPQMQPRCRNNRYLGTARIRDQRPGLHQAVDFPQRIQNASDGLR